MTETAKVLPKTPPAPRRATQMYPMKNSSALLKTSLPLLCLTLPLLLCQTLPAAVTFTVTPSAVSNTYSGSITLQINGLATGDTVLVQKYLDANANSVIDAPDILVQQF